jgi:hypothetical protein
LRTASRLHRIINGLNRRCIHNTMTFILLK